MIIVKHYKPAYSGSPGQTLLRWVEVIGAKDSAELRKWIRKEYGHESTMVFPITVKETESEP